MATRSSRSKSGSSKSNRNQGRSKASSQKSDNGRGRSSRSGGR